MNISAFQWLVFFIILYFLVWPIYSAYIFTRPPRLRISFRKPSDSGLEYREARFSSSDGAEMDGWYVPSQNGAAVVLLHGHSGNRLAVLVHMEALATAGFGVLLFDLRAHGSSEGRRFSQGRLLLDDVTAALAYVRRQPDADARRIGLMGVSVGGTIALHAAAGNSHIRAVAADGPNPATVADIWPPASLRQRVQLPRYLLYQRTVRWLTRAAPLPPLTAVVGKIAPRPLLLIATGRGGEQQFIRRLYAAAGQPKAVWEIPEARHAGGWSGGRETIYGQRIVQFFGQALVDDRSDRVRG